MFDQIHSPSGSGLLLKDFTLQFQLNDLWWVRWYLLFLASSVLEGCTFLRICAFLLFVQFIFLELLIVMSFEPLCFYSVSCHFSFFISNFIDLSPLPIFFLDKSLWKFTNFNYLFKEPVLVSLIFLAIVVFIPISFIYAPIFMISFLLPTLFCFFFL